MSGRISSRFLLFVGLLAGLGNAGLQVYPPVLNTTSMVATVTWTGVAHPNADDYIEATPKGHMLWSHSFHTKKVSTCTKWQTGNCSVWFVVMHVNKDYEFRYISKPHNQVLHSFILPAPDYPLFAYLAPTKRPNELQLVWTLRALTNGEARYGTDPANLKHLATAKAWQEPYRDKCKPLWGTYSVRYTAVLTDLVPGQTYYYIYGSSQTGLWSSVRSFQGPPDHNSQVNILLTADTTPDHLDSSAGRDVNSRMARHLYDQVNKRQGTLLFLNGDLSYAKQQYEWMHWWAPYEAVATRIPLITSKGNHDCASLYNLYFPMIEDEKKKEPAEDAHVTNFFSFDHGPVHFIVLNLHVGLGVCTPECIKRQKAWLAVDLAAVNRSQTPWIIVGSHLPFYTTWTPWWTKQESIKRTQELDPLLEEYHVDLTIGAHVHQYERTCRVLNETCVEDGEHYGIVHTVVGTGGRAKHEFSSSEHWIRNRYLVKGYARIKADHTTLQWEYVYTQPDNLDGSDPFPPGAVLDSFTLIKPNPNKMSHVSSSSQLMVPPKQPLKFWSGFPHMYDNPWLLWQQFSKMIGRVLHANLSLISDEV